MLTSRKGEVKILTPVHLGAILVIPARSDQDAWMLIEQWLSVELEAHITVFYERAIDARKMLAHLMHSLRVGRLVKVPQLDLGERSGADSQPNRCVQLIYLVLDDLRHIKVDHTL